MARTAMSAPATLRNSAHGRTYRWSYQQTAKQAECASRRVITTRRKELLFPSSASGEMAERYPAASLLRSGCERLRRRVDDRDRRDRSMAGRVHSLDSLLGNNLGGSIG